MALNDYDALGRLKSKKVGGTDVSGGASLQIVDYKYNIRGWLTDINDIDNLARQGNAPQNLFAFKINYTDVTDDINGAVQPLYNGNISETFWKTSSDNTSAPLSAGTSASTGTATTIRTGCWPHFTKSPPLPFPGRIPIAPGTATTATATSSP